MVSPLSKSCGTLHVYRSFQSYQKAINLTRLSAQSAKFEAGLVWLPEHAAWLADYERELLTFPMSVHDDQVDSTSQFLGWASTCAQQYGYERVGNSSELSSRGVW